MRLQALAPALAYLRSTRTPRISLTAAASECEKPAARRQVMPAAIQGSSSGAPA